MIICCCKECLAKMRVPPPSSRETIRITWVDKKPTEETTIVSEGTK